MTGVLALAAVLLARNPTPGLWLGLATSLLVAGPMLPRFLQSGTFFPAGLTLALSVITLVVAVVALLAKRPVTHG